MGRTYAVINYGRAPWENLGKGAGIEPSMCEAQERNGAEYVRDNYFV